MNKDDPEIAKAYKETIKKGRLLLAVMFVFAVVLQYMDIKGYRFDPSKNSSARSAAASKLIGLLPENPAAQFIIILTAAAVIYILMVQLKQIFIEGKFGVSFKGAAIKAGKYPYDVQMLVVFHLVCYFLSFIIVLIGMFFYLRSSIIMELYLSILIFFFLYKKFSPEYEKWEKHLNDQRRGHEAGGA